MREQYINFETATLAKEKKLVIGSNYYYGGHDWYVGDEMRYHNNGLVMNDSLNSFEDVCEAIPQSLLQKWLRETHKLHIEIYGVGGNYLCYKIQSFFNTEGSFIQTKKDSIQYDELYNSYEECLEIGLQETLKLI